MLKNFAWVIYIWQVGVNAWMLLTWRSSPVQVYTTHAYLQKFQGKML